MKRLLHVDLNRAVQQSRDDVGRRSAADDFAPRSMFGHHCEIMIVGAIERGPCHHQQLSRAAEVNHGAGNVVFRAEAVNFLGFSN